MFCPVLIFDMYRSGGSYVSQILSAGRPILTEPSLPDDAPGVALTENIQRLQDFHQAAPGYQVVKVCRFAHYLDTLKDRGMRLPEGFAPIVLFRHPYTQIASQLYTFDGWADRWTPHAVFFRAIEAYASHVRLAKLILQAYPAAKLLRYEDTLGEGMDRTLRELFGEDGYQEARGYAEQIRGLNFRLGPAPEGGAWLPGAYELTPMEKRMVWERLTTEMEFLGYETGFAHGG